MSQETCDSHSASFQIHLTSTFDPITSLLNEITIPKKNQVHKVFFFRSLVETNNHEDQSQPYHAPLSSRSKCFLCWDRMDQSRLLWASLPVLETPMEAENKGLPVKLKLHWKTREVSVLRWPKWPKDSQMALPRERLSMGHRKSKHPRWKCGIVRRSSKVDPFELGRVPQTSRKSKLC